MADVEVEVEGQDDVDLEDGAQDVTPGEVETQEGKQQTGQPDFEKRVQGLETALTEERKERQRAQRELDYIRGAVEQRGGGQTTSQTQPKPLFESDTEFWEDIPSTLNKIYQKALNDSVRVAMDQMTNDRINRQALEMAHEHEDYPEAQEAFVQAVNFNPALKAAVLQAPNPARAIYQWHQQQKAGASGDVAALQARIAELEKQLNPEAEKPPPKTQAGKRQAGPSSASSASDMWADSPLDQ